MPADFLFRPAAIAEFANHCDADPYQRTNLASDPRYATKLAELDVLTTQLKADAQ